MRVERENKVLYHIQNMNMTTDGTPFDTFVWSDHELTEEDLRKVHHDEFCGVEDEEYLLEEFLSSSGIYPVWAEDLNDLERR